MEVVYKYFDEESIKRYKSQIDKDFENFTNNPRLVQLEILWIKNLSHKLMPIGQHFSHAERQELRKILMEHLRKKYCKIKGVKFKWKVK